MPKVILHADLNNFYASVACLNRPRLHETPFVVCGNPELRHGIVLAKNIPAKKCGIQTGQTLWQARQLCQGLMTVAPDFDEVLRMSAKVREIFSRYTSHVQPFGVDEAWLDLSEPGMTLARGEDVANHLRHTVREETGLTVSVGVSDNRIFAKLGSDLKKPDAVSVICEQNRAKILDPLPVSELLFIGSSTARKLNSIGIYTIGQLARINPAVLKGLLGKTGETLSGFARGNDAAAILDSDAVTKAKSIGNSITTARDLRTREEARLTLFGLCDSVASRMRKHGLVGSVVQLSMRDRTFKTMQRQSSLSFSTACSYELFAASYDLLTRHWDEGVPLRLLGVSVSNLSGADAMEQISFLPQEAQRQKHAAIERTVDQIRERYGHFAIQRAIMLSNGALGQMNPEEEHVLHPEPYFK